MSLLVNFPEPSIAVVSFNRPQVLNALNWQSLEEFSKIVDRFYLDKKLRAVIITGSGTRAFSAGGDLNELHQYPSESDGRRLSEIMTLALRKLEAAPFPTIAAINGIARGGGVEIALACDIRIMAKNADLGFTQIKLGLTPGWGVGQRLLKTVGYSLAFDWLSSGAILDADEALRNRLVNRIVAEGAAVTTALDIARNWAKNPERRSWGSKRCCEAVNWTHRRKQPGWKAKYFRVSGLQKAIGNELRSF